MMNPERGDSKGSKRTKENQIMATAISSFLLIMVGTVVLWLAPTVHHNPTLNVGASFNNILSRWSSPYSLPPSLDPDLAKKQQLCNSTSYPDVCMQSLNGSSTSSNSIELVSLAATYALQRLNFSYYLSYRLANQQSSNSMETAALQDCTELLADSMDQLSLSASALSSLSNSSSNPSLLDMQIQDIQAQLSSSISFQTTCSDGCSTYSPDIRSKLLLTEQDTLSKLIANCLSLVNSLRSPTEQPDGNSWHRRRHLLVASNDKEDQHLVFSLQSGYPDWLSTRDRNLLQVPASSVSADAVVAQDGTGQYRTLQEAVNKIPKDYSGRYVIYIKAGVYQENVTIAKKYKNVMLLGDGINRTIITGNRNVALQNYTTYRSATVAVSSPGFMAKEITFQNTAGPQGHQAVAMRVNGDLSAFVSCSFEGYQDTLYALAGRQFYRNCDIYGTVDYIFGNAIGIFQKCNLYARRPMIGQQNTYTAQSRTVKDDPSGYSFQNCSLLPSDDLATSSYHVATYLGRPWKQYSRTVYLRSYMDNLINVAGWLAWNSSNPYINTLYYGEYNNTGPGSNVSQRVTWSGVHSNMSFHDASVFSPNKFISARTWLPDDGVTYEELS